MEIRRSLVRCQCEIKQWNITFVCDGCWNSRISVDRISFLYKQNSTLSLDSETLDIYYPITWSMSKWTRSKPIIFVVSKFPQPSTQSDVKVTYTFPNKIAIRKDAFFRFFGCGQISLNFIRQWNQWFRVSLRNSPCCSSIVGSQSLVDLFMVLFKFTNIDVCVHSISFISVIGHSFKNLVPCQRCIVTSFLGCRIKERYIQQCWWWMRRSLF